jgi:hypothetical protein
MFRFPNALRSAIALTIVALVAACTEDSNNQVLGPKPTGANSIFQSYVSLGNSITAGYQSSGINSGTQVQSYAVLLAGQMGTRFAIPTLAGRGCAPPVVNFLTQARFGNTTAAPVTSSTCDLRAAASTDIINNVAVPGAAVKDLTAATGSSASNILTSLFLGGKSQVQKALDAKPTFASIWAGNNDILGPALSGVLVPFAGVSAGVTPQAAFQTSYDAAIAELTAGAPNLKGVLIGVGNVANLPVLFPVAAFNNAAFRAGFDQAAGFLATSTDPVKASPLQIDANCSAAPTTLVSFLIVSEIAKFRNDAGKLPQNRVGHPAYIACGVSSTPGAPGSPVGEVFILTTAEQTSLAASLAAYNTYISGKATSLGWAYMNPNVLGDSLKAAGAFPSAPILNNATAPFGAWISLDGVHPSAQAHKAIMNHVAKAINATYSTTLVLVTVP